MMIASLQKSQRLFGEIRFAYALFYMAFFFLSSIVPYYQIGGGGYAFTSAVNTAIAVIGFLLLAIDFFWNRRLFRIPFVDLLVLFFIAYAISILLNREYDLSGNVKGFLWMAIQVFLLCAADDELDEQVHLRHIRLLIDTIILLQLIGVVWSLVQYAAGYGDYIKISMSGTETYKRVGFIENRLFGVFTDPNYASILSLVCTCLAAYRLKTGSRSVWMRIYYIAGMVFQLSYAILSGSRTGELALIGTAFFVGGFFAVTRLLNKKMLIRGAAFVLAGILSVGVVAGAHAVAKIGLSYVPVIVQMSGVSGDSNVPEKPADLDREDLADGENLSNNRIQIWADCLTILTKAPLFGTSPRSHLAFAADHFDDLFIVERQYSVHNGYLVLFVGTGVIGGGLMLIWLVAVVVAILGYLIRQWHARDTRYWFVFYGTLTLLIQAISAFPLQALFFCNKATDILFWLLLGYIFWIVRRSEPERHNKFGWTGRLFSRVFRKKETATSLPKQK